MSEPYASIPLFVGYCDRMEQLWPAFRKLAEIEGVDGVRGMFVRVGRRLAADADNQDAEGQYLIAETLRQMDSPEGRKYLMAKLGMM